jgi:hypothetical protein
VFLEGKERWQAVAFTAVLIVAIAGVYAATLATQPAPVTPSVVHAAMLEVQGGSWTIRYRPDVTTNNTAFGILREASERLGFPLAYVPYEIPNGIFVTAINGSTNGDGGSYWQFWVNGDYGTVAADHRALHDGDAVLWTFSVPREGG